MLTSSQSVDAKIEFNWGYCALTHDKLQVDAIITSVKSDIAGANVVFIGTTRDNFEGKKVTKLEYQAYSKLAIQTICDILRTIQVHHPEQYFGEFPVGKCAVEHRLGVVPVGEPSIVIAVSSPHRKEAFETCEIILEQVKARAQIWKREFYEDVPDEEAIWKANW